LLARFFANSRKVWVAHAGQGELMGE